MNLRNLSFLGVPPYQNESEQEVENHIGHLDVLPRPDSCPEDMLVTSFFFHESYQ